MDARPDAEGSSPVTAGIVEKTASIGVGSDLVELYTVTLCAPAARWTIALRAGAPCVVRWRLSLGESADVLPYAVNGSTTVAAQGVSRPVLAAWISTGLVRCARVEVAHDVGVWIPVGARLVWDAGWGGPVEVEAVPGTVIL